MILKTTKLKKSIAMTAMVIGALAPLQFANASIPTDGLIGSWAGNNNANDSSPTGNNGSFSGSYVSGANGPAFDLSTDKMSIPDNPAYSFGPGLFGGFLV